MNAVVLTGAGPRLLLRHRHARLRAPRAGSVRPRDRTAAVPGSDGALPQAIWDLPQPVIAAVNGPCVGRGIRTVPGVRHPDLLDGSHIRQRRDSAGLSGAEMGMRYHLPRIVGTSVAADWMLTGPHGGGGRSRPREAAWSASGGRAPTVWAHGRRRRSRTGVGHNGTWRPGRATV